jgi:hypothetical protein
MAELQPTIGNWYKNIVSGETFEVVALDDGAQTVEIQHFEGELEDLDRDTWSDLELAELPPQEDWSGPFDDLEREEIEIDGSANGMRWANPLDKLD